MNDFLKKVLALGGELEKASDGMHIHMIINDAILHYEELESDNEKFAIGFADWLDKLTPSQRVSVWSKNGEYSGLFTMDNEQLIEKYKKYLKDKNKENVKNTSIS